MSPQEGSGKFEKQALTEHLRELRSCLIVSFVAVFIGFCLSYSVIRPIGTWFFKPLTEVLPARYIADLHLLPGRVFFYLKLALVCGLLLASPVIFSQIWRFVAPGLYSHEKRVLIPFSLLSTCCFHRWGGLRLFRRLPTRLQVPGRLQQ